MIDNDLEKFHLKNLHDFVDEFNSLQDITDDARQRIVEHFIKYTKVPYSNFNFLALMQIKGKVKNYSLTFNESNDKILILKHKDNLDLPIGKKDQGIIILEVPLNSDSANIENNPCAAFLIQNHLINKIFLDALWEKQPNEIIQLKEILDSLSKESFKNGQQSVLYVDNINKNREAKGLAIVFKRQDIYISFNLDKIFNNKENAIDVICVRAGSKINDSLQMSLADLRMSLPNIDPHKDNLERLKKHVIDKSKENEPTEIRSPLSKVMSLLSGAIFLMMAFEAIMFFLGLTVYTSRATFSAAGTTANFIFETLGSIVNFALGSIFPLGSKLLGIE